MPEYTAEERRILALIPAAKNQDQYARETIVRFVYKQFLKRVSGLYSFDAAVCRDDINAEFMRGIYAHLDKVDDRGDPLYHLGQRGVWAAMSLCRAAQRMKENVLIVSGHYMESLDATPDMVHVPCAKEDFTEILVRRDEAHSRVVSLVANTSITGTPRRLIELILAGEVDPTELGFVKEAAGKLGVSAQRVSQCMQQIRKAENARIEEAA